MDKTFLRVRCRWRISASNAQLATVMHMPKAASMTTSSRNSKCTELAAAASNSADENMRIGAYLKVGRSATCAHLKTEERGSKTFSLFAKQTERRVVYFDPWLAVTLTIRRVLCSSFCLDLRLWWGLQRCIFPTRRLWLL